MPRATALRIALLFAFLAGCASEPAPTGPLVPSASPPTPRSVGWRDAALSDGLSEPLVAIRLPSKSVSMVEDIWACELDQKRGDAEMRARAAQARAQERAQQMIQTPRASSKATLMRLYRQVEADKADFGCVGLSGDQRGYKDFVFPVEGLYASRRLSDTVRMRCYYDFGESEEDARRRAYEAIRVDAAAYEERTSYSSATPEWREHYQRSRDLLRDRYKCGTPAPVIPA